MSNDNRELMALALRAAREASLQILEIYATNFDVRVKDDRTPVTLADERAEACIIALLTAEAPLIPVVAEEQTAALTGPPPPAPPRFWLVDPLDGTREFLARNGEFTVNIALVEGTRPVLGVVHLPVTGITYAASGPGTATRQEGNEAPRPIAARVAPAAAVVTHSRSHADEAAIAAYVATHPGATRRVMGSSAKFCLLAAGEADFYPRFGPTMEWDTAAGQAVLEAAGGAVQTMSGSPLAYAKPGYRNPDFIARGRGRAPLGPGP